jgi:hypothetical protein
VNVTLFLCGLLIGLVIGSVAATLAHIYWILPPAFERAYREGWFKLEPAFFAEAARRRGQRAVNDTGTREN